MRSYTLNELKSSRLQYDKKPPKLMMWIIFTTLFLLCAIIVISIFTYKTEVVRAGGVLASDIKTPIQSQTGGKITKLNHNSGDYVEKGSVLFELDATQVQSNIIAIKGKVDYMQQYVDNYNLMIDKLGNADLSVNTLGENPFQKSDFYFMWSSMDNEYSAAKAEGELTLQQAREKVVNQYLQSFYQSKMQYEYELLGNSRQLDAYNEMLDSYKVYAYASGYVNYFADIQVGAVIDNNAIGSISDTISKDNVIIDCYIDTGSRSFIKVGDSVEVVMAGLSQSKYGTLKAKVHSISDDVVVDKEGNVFYKVQVKPNATKLKDVELTNGQQGEIRIKYDSVTWMNWMLKKIGIIDR